MDDPSASAPGRRLETESEPVGTSHFRVFIDGVEVAFSFVGGLTSEASETDLEDEKRGAVHRWRRVVLRRAITQSKGLFRWRQAVVEGREDHREVRIEQYDPAAERLVNAWVLHEAWPCRWSGPAFDAMIAAVAMEEVELCFDRVSWEYPQDDDTEGGRHGGRS